MGSLGDFGVLRVVLGSPEKMSGSLGVLGGSPGFLGSPK